MREYVQIFLENNIDFIDDENWKVVIDIWMNNAELDFAYDDLMFADLVSVFSASGIDFLTVTNDVRKKAIQDNIRNALRSKFRSNEKTIVSKAECLWPLPTYLGFADNEIEEMMDNIASTEFDLVVGEDRYIKI